jgi:hypothetical protein
VAVAGFHWITSTNNTYTWPGVSHNLGPADIVIPAGGLLRKVLVKQNVVNFTQTGNGYLVVGTWYVSQVIQFSGTAYAGRHIFDRYNRLPSNLSCVYDVPATERIYTSYVNAGDETMGVNEKMSYGGHGSSGLQLKYLCALNMAAPNLSPNPTDFFFETTIAALYYL